MSLSDPFYLVKLEIQDTVSAQSILLVFLQLFVIDRKDSLLQEML